MHKLLPGVKTMLKGVAMPQSGGPPQLQPSSHVKVTTLYFHCNHIQRKQAVIHSQGLLHDSHQQGLLA